MTNIFQKKNKLSKSKKDRKFINKKGKNKIVKPEELDEWLINGWNIGKYKGD